MGNLNTEFMMSALKWRLPHTSTPKNKITPDWGDLRENIKKFGNFKLPFRYPMTENLIAPMRYLVAQVN